LFNEQQVLGQRVLSVAIDERDALAALARVPGFFLVLL
jgi:hypothetical protein